MFETPGKKIKKIAIILFWICTIACVILAFVFGFEKYYEYGYFSSREVTEFHAGWFFGFLIGGPLVLYIETLFLVAFGELVEHAESLNVRKLPKLIAGVESLSNVPFRGHIEQVANYIDSQPNSGKPQE